MSSDRGPTCFFSQIRSLRVSKGVMIRNLHKDSRTLSVHQAEPAEILVVLQTPKVPLALGAQHSPIKIRGLRFDSSIEKPEMPSRQSSPAAV